MVGAHDVRFPGMSSWTSASPDVELRKRTVVEETSTLTAHGTRLHANRHGTARPRHGKTTVRIWCATATNNRSSPLDGGDQGAWTVYVPGSMIEAAM